MQRVSQRCSILQDIVDGIHPRNVALGPARWAARQWHHARRRHDRITVAGNDIARLPSEQHPCRGRRQRHQRAMTSAGAPTRTVSTRRARPGTPGQATCGTKAHRSASAPCRRLAPRVGAWRSLVAHQSGGLVVAGSNPAAPTNSPARNGSPRGEPDERGPLTAFWPNSQDQGTTMPGSQMPSWSASRPRLVVGSPSC